MRSFIVAVAVNPTIPLAGGVAGERAPSAIPHTSAVEESSRPVDTITLVAGTESTTLKQTDAAGLESSTKRPATAA